MMNRKHWRAEVSEQLVKLSDELYPLEFNFGPGGFREPTPEIKARMSDLARQIEALHTRLRSAQ